MRRLVTVVALLAGTLVADLTLAPPAGATEILVGNAATYRNALTTLSAETGVGPHVVRLTSDVNLVADIEPVYTGTRELIIDGDGHTISGNDLNRIIDHQSTARLTVRDITIRNGHTPPGNDGGAITVDGPLTVTDVTFEDNHADSNGGAIETSTAAVTIADSTFVGNSAEHIGGAIESNGNLTVTNTDFVENRVEDPVLSALGGGAVSLGGGTVTFTDSSFTGNQATDDTSGMSGGAIRSSGANLTLTRVEVADNTVSDGQGGAIQSSSGSVTVVDSTFTGNRVLGGDSGSVGGGAIRADGVLTVSGSTFEGNDTVDAPGGAIRLGNNATATITGSELRDNHTVGPAADGGAIQSGADSLVIQDTVLADNSTDGQDADGGAVAAEVLTITGSDVRENEVQALASQGGAIISRDLELSDTWMVANHADGNGGIGGAVAGEFGPDEAVITRTLFLRNTAEGTTGSGGAVGEFDDLTLTNSTAIGNRATNSGGAVVVPAGGHALLQHVTLGRNHATLGAQLASTAGTTTVEASVLAEPSGGLDCVTAISGAILSAGYNRESAASCGFTQGTDGQNVTELELGPLRGNGGATATMFPLNGSPLVDQVPAAQCELDEDQRGVERPFGGGCDIGAVEQVFPEHPFNDVPPWVEDAVRWMAWPGNDPQIMLGMTPTKFRAADPITRAQVVRMLYNEAGAPDPTVYPPHGFTDVPPWVESAVRWAKGEGILVGMTPTTFVPNDPITRAQVVRMKYRFAGSPDVSGIDPHPFRDVPPWVQDAVTWAANPDNVLRLIVGMTPTTFEPATDITRAQVARMDWRLAFTPNAWADPAEAPFAMLFSAGA